MRVVSAFMISSTLKISIWTGPLTTISIVILQNLILCRHVVLSITCTLKPKI